MFRASGLPATLSPVFAVLDCDQPRLLGFAGSSAGVQRPERTQAKRSSPPSNALRLEMLSPANSGVQELAGPLIGEPLRLALQSELGTELAVSWGHHPAPGVASVPLPSGVRFRISRSYAHLARRCPGSRVAGGHRGAPLMPGIGVQTMRIGSAARKPSPGGTRIRGV